MVTRKNETRKYQKVKTEYFQKRRFKQIQIYHSKITNQKDPKIWKWGLDGFFLSSGETRALVVINLFIEYKKKDNEIIRTKWSESSFKIGSKTYQSKSWEPLLLYSHSRKYST